MTTATNTLNSTLQEIFILATGRAASAQDITWLEGFVGPDNDWSPMATLVNNTMTARATQTSTAQTLKAIALNGLGMVLDNDRAQELAHEIESGASSWADIYERCIDMADAYGQTLNNRADAAQHFVELLSQAGKSDLFDGSAVHAAVTNLLQGIDANNVSLQTAKANFQELTGKLSPNGIQGFVVDGYVKGATVFIDSNGDGILNIGEWSTTTGEDGSYSLPAGVAPGTLVATGGIDLLTGLPFQGALAAPAGATQVNPLTTLMQGLIGSGHANGVQAAAALVQQVLNLPAGVDPLTYDPLAVLADSTASPEAQATALQAQATMLQVVNVISHTSAAIQAATGDSLISAAIAVVNALSNAAGTGQTLDLTSATTLQSIIVGAAANAGIVTTPDAPIAQALASITSASNTAAQQATSIAQLAQAASVAQGSAINAISQGVTQGSLDDAAQHFTGDALQEQIDQAPVGEVAPGVSVPDSPTPPPGGGGGTTPTFTATANNDGSLIFGGSATGNITLAVEAGNVVFTRSNIKVTTDLQLSADTPPLKISVSENQKLVVAGSVLHQMGVHFLGTGLVDVTGVTINPSHVAGTEAQFASTNFDLSKVLRLNITDRGALDATAPTIYINGSEVDFIKASWVYFDRSYYSDPNNPWANYYNTDLNEAKADLALLYTEYLHRSDPAPFLNFVAKSAVNGSGVQTREQTLHDNILGELTHAALEDRNLLDYAARAGEYTLRPWIDGVFANAYNASQNNALRFDYDKGWDRPDYIHEFVGSVDASAIKDDVEMYFGAGNSVTNFNIARHEGAGVELALKAKIRLEGDVAAPNTDGDIPLYTVPKGTGATTGWTPAKWSFDFSIATGLNGSARNLDDFDFTLSVDVDPTEEVSFIKFKLLKEAEIPGEDGNPGPGRVWLRLTDEGSYDPAPSAGGLDYAQKNHTDVNDLISQNSVNIGFSFIKAHLPTYDFGDGLFNIRLDAYRLESDLVLIGNEIQVHVYDPAG